jgi:hypothetical protein
MKRETGHWNRAARQGGGPRRYILAPAGPTPELARLLEHYGQCAACKVGPELCPRGIELADQEAASASPRER